MLEVTLAGDWLLGIRGLDKHHEKYSCWRKRVWWLWRSLGSWRSFLR